MKNGLTATRPLQIQLNTYWTQTTAGTMNTIMTSNAPLTTAPGTNTNRIRDAVDRLEKNILQYIQHCTQHVKNMSENKIRLAQIEIDEYKALEDFKEIANPNQWNIHLMLKSKMKQWSTKNKNYITAAKRIEYDLPPKFISSASFTFKIDESIVSRDEAQILYDQMRQLTKDYRMQAMSLYLRATTREKEILKNEIDNIIKGFIQENAEDFNIELDSGYIAFKYYNELREKRLNLEAQKAEENELLKLGPRFIYNDPKTASRRRITELATLKRKIEARFFEQKVSPGKIVEKFIAELNIILKNLHATSTNKLNHKTKQQNNQTMTYDNLLESIQLNQNKIEKCANTVGKKNKKNYNRIIKRLKYKLRSTSTVIQKTDKSKVFHLGKLQDYHKKSEEYMKKTEAYKCLDQNDPLPSLIERTNKYLLNLRLKNLITQKQYEKLGIKPNEVELAHLYYLPKAHKPDTPLRPIISGLKHPTIKISKFLDEILRPLFDQMAANTTVTCGTEVIKQLHDWSKQNLREETILCSMDVIDLYTMIPQTEGILAIRKMLNYLNIKQIKGLTIETIIRLCRFVVHNNYFSYNEKFYYQVRGGAMGSPLTLTITNCYMFFFERSIVKQVNNSNGLYLRYIDDIFITINWPIQHLLKQINRWNQFDINIKLKEQIGQSTNFLDLYIENKKDRLFTKVYHKPSYKPYYLPFTSVHPNHMKMNIPYTMLIRAIKYCSTFETYVDEREKLRMAFLLNKYPNEFIDKQFDRVFQKHNLIQPVAANDYKIIREKLMYSQKNENIQIDYRRTLFVHFTYCLNMKTFLTKFHALWNKYFTESPINEIKPVLGTRNHKNERLEFENQITKIQTMVEFERSRDTVGHVEQIIEDLQNEISEIKDRLLDQKKKIEFQEREIADCRKCVAQLNKDYNEQRKHLQLIESDIEKLRMDQHNYFRTAKLNEILLPFPSNSGSMTAILLTEITLSDDTNIPIQSTTTTTTTDSSTASNDDRNYPTIDACSREVKTTFELITNAEFEHTQHYDRFNTFYEHVSTCIDDIYKSLTNFQDAVACLTAENAEESYCDGITYNCTAPAPLFLLDEVDVALDNTNIGKVADFIREQSASKFQCIVISLKEQFYSRAGALIAIFPKPGDCITSYCFTLDLNQFDERENIANRCG
ncbi:unnamed protein product [Rotaria sp. Silwood1]|nr:unnamed protein product [Rotaria sp. Silwood1]